MFCWVSPDGFQNYIENNVRITNLNHGGLKSNVKNVYSTFREYDPWRPPGVEYYISKTSETVIIPSNLFYL